MEKIIMKTFDFLLCWILWIFPTIGDLEDVGQEFGGITCIFLSLATTAILVPFLFWGLHVAAMDLIWIDSNTPRNVLEFLPFTLPVGLSVYLIIGVIYHIAIGAYGGASWYANYKNVSIS